jgi:hypothetical protein
MIILKTRQCRRLRLTEESESRLDSDVAEKLDISVKKEVTVNNNRIQLHSLPSL